MLALACDYCVQRGQENINHIFSSGEVAADVWRRASVLLGIPSHRTMPWKNRLTTWFSFARKSSISGILIGIMPCVITWGLWNRRCKVRMEGRNKNFDQVWRQIRYWVSALVENSKTIRMFTLSDMELVRELNLSLRPMCARLGKLISWIKPPTSWVKLNCDGSCRGNMGNSGGGGIIRDC